MLVKILKFSILKSLNKPTFMTNIVKNYFRVLEVISSLNCELEYKSGVGRIQKMSDLLPSRASRLGMPRSKKMGSLFQTETCLDHFTSTEPPGRN